MKEENNKIIITPKRAVYSGHELVIIPINPKFKPNINQINYTLDILKKMYPNCKITSEIYDSINFVDQGENFEKVSCNYCKRELTIDFWQERMFESYDNTHFENMDFQTTCCKTTTNLNDLIYIGDCGFASYSISINNAEFDANKESELKKTLSNTLGNEIKIFWRHI